MNSVKVNRKETGLFSEQQIKMVYDQDYYSDFINQPFDIESFKSQIKEKEKSFSMEKREKLRDTLLLQYRNTSKLDSVDKSINDLTDPNTFTITTGHQLSLFTGPLYFIVKILHVIKMCEELKEKYPNNNFVPVYWMATEDHDFEEIQSCNLFNQKINWESEQKGPVGRFDLQGIYSAQDKLIELFSNHKDGEISAVIDSLQGKNYAEAMRSLVHKLFSDRGLVIVDGDDKSLKEMFAPVIKKAIAIPGKAA